jgi:hypothetical protein
VVVDTLLRIGVTLAYGSIAWYMVRHSLSFRNYAHLSIGLHFSIIVLRMVATLLWGDAPAEWMRIHRLTAMICMWAIMYEVRQETACIHGK